MVERTLEDNLMGEHSIKMFYPNTSVDETLSVRPTLLVTPGMHQLPTFR